MYMLLQTFRQHSYVQYNAFNVKQTMKTHIIISVAKLKLLHYQPRQRL